MTHMPLPTLATMEPWLLPAALLAVPLLWLILTYNSLVGFRNRMRNAASGIDVQLKKRHDLIPNLVAAVRGYMQHEREVLESVTRLRIEAGTWPIQDPVRMANEREIGSCIGVIRARAEAYPELRAGEHFTLLMRSLNEIEEQISASRRSYNAAVEQLNNKVEAFPSNLVASWFGFGLANFFEAIESDRAVPDVRLATGA